jgi:hypothetical protein
MRISSHWSVQPGTNAKLLQTAQAIPPSPAIPGDQQPIYVLRRRPDIMEIAAPVTPQSWSDEAPAQDGNP